MKEGQANKKRFIIFYCLCLMGIGIIISCSNDQQTSESTSPVKVDPVVKKEQPAASAVNKSKEPKQNSTKENINYRDVNIDLLAELIHLEINKVRNSFGLKELKINKVLKNAATDHNNYLVSIGDLSHEQKNANKKYPKDRVKSYGGGFSALAENVIYEGFIIRTSSNGHKQIITPTYEAMAKKMVRSWMDSPGHRKNIVNPLYDEVGTGVGYHGSLHAVFATQVFGKK